MTTYHPTGCCSVCGYRFRLRKDRTLGMHYRWNGRHGTECDGVGKPDKHAEHNRQARAALKESP
jgi:hypothetical protein